MVTRLLKELADHVSAVVVGDGDITIGSAATLEQAGPGDISFLANKRYEKYLAGTKASAVVVDKDCQVETRAALLRVDDPYYAFGRIMVLLHGYRKHRKTGISEKAFIAESAEIGADCDISEFVTVCEDVKIGDRCVLYPGVYIGPGTQIGDDCVLHASAAVYEDCRIGSRVIIHANTTIGGDGFGFARQGHKHFKLPHIGKAVIEDEVEIGANCTIERGTIDDTVIGQGTKIGDLVAVGHGTKVGQHCLIVAQAGLAGSVNIGHHCVIGGQVGVVGHIKIGDMVQIGAQSGVINDVPSRQVVLGAPAVDASRARRAYSMFQYLPEMRKEIRKLQKQFARLENSEQTVVDKGHGQ